MVTYFDHWLPFVKRNQFVNLQVTLFLDLQCIYLSDLIILSGAQDRDGGLQTPQEPEGFCLTPPEPAPLYAVQFYLPQNKASYLEMDFANYPWVNWKMAGLLAMLEAQKYTPYSWCGLAITLSGRTTTMYTPFFTDSVVLHGSQMLLRNIGMRI